MSNEDRIYMFSETTEEIISAAYKVYNKLGAGFLEKVYENSLAVELKRRGLKVEQQRPIKVFYEGTLVGDYFADLIVENKIIIELKAIKELNQVHHQQLVNYLKSTNMKVGLLINFGEEGIDIKRKVNQTESERMKYK